jgi:hypothetical protein
MMQPPLPSNALEVSIGPLPVAAGQEIVMCSTVRLPGAEDVDIVRIQSELAPGSHHLVLYRSDALTETAPRRCTSFDGVLRGEAPIFIAESATSDMTLPSGVAYHFTAGQMFRLEAHYINASPTAIMGMGRFRLVPGEKNNTYLPADIMMCGSLAGLLCEVGGGIDPGEQNYSLPVGFYNGRGVNVRGGQSYNYDLTQLKVFAFTSHTHHHGSEVKVWKSSSDKPTTDPIYVNTSWDNPPLKTYGLENLLRFGPGEGFAWQCSYDTTAETQKVCWGESANDEMCFIWAYYYPSVGRFIAQDDCWAN